MIFDHDWWYGGAFDRQVALAKRCCMQNRFPEAPDAEPAAESPEGSFIAQLETRTVAYLRDGFSYELKRLVNMGTSGYLSFECAPAEASYRVGAFVLSVPFEELCRVETFAVHRDERPDETPMIKGFGGTRVPSAARGEERSLRHEPRPSDGEPEADDEDA
jgi:hypothetical protein